MSYELKDMNLGPGDVVGFVSRRPSNVGWISEVNREYTVDDQCEKVTNFDGWWARIAKNSLGAHFTIVSRATPVPFGKLTPIEQQELRDAADRGETIEYGGGILRPGLQGSWVDCTPDPLWAPQGYYRIKPTPVEETVVLTSMPLNDGFVVTKDDDEEDTRKVTFPLHDGDLRPGTYVDTDGHKVVIESVQVTTPVQLGDTITIQVTPHITVRGECRAIRNDGVYEVRSSGQTLWLGTLISPERNATSE